MSQGVSGSRLHSSQSTSPKEPFWNPSETSQQRSGAGAPRHRKTAIFGWLAFVVIAFVIGGKIGTNTLTTEQSGVGDSGKASRIVDGAYPKKVHEAVLIQSKTFAADSPQFHAAVSDVAHRLEQSKGVTKIVTPYSKSGGGAISPDKHSGLLAFEIKGDLEVAAVDAALVRSVGAVKAAGKSPPRHHRRAVRRRQLREGVHEDLREGSSEGRDQLDPVHTDRARARVRIAAAGRSPGPARDHRRRRDVRPDRPAQPDLRRSSRRSRT